MVGVVDAGQVAEFGDGRHHRVDFHRPAALEVLQHRGLVLADLAAAFYAAVDVDGEADAERLPDALRLEHRGTHEAAQIFVLGDCLQGQSGQRADRIERDVAPQFDPDFVADARADGRAQAGLHHRLRQRGGARALRPVGLADRETVAVAMLDHARRHQLRRRQHDAAQGALRPERVPDRAARIDRRDAAILIRPGELVKIPPRHPVHRVEDRGIRAAQQS